MSNTFEVIDYTPRNPLVTVAMLAYNHEEFIVEALESVLMQVTSFKVKLIIAEDYSTDKTRDIVQKYQKKFPENIMLILQNKNVGAQLNNKTLFEHFEGKYIAALEGDDYWSDPYKLQKQVDFLEANEDCIFIFHKVNELNDDTLTLDELNPEKKSRFTLDDVLTKNYAHTPSIVFRNPDFSKFPSFFSTAMPGDHTLQILLLKDGGFAYFMEDVMAVYRRHDGGIWSSDDGAKYHLETAITKINIYYYLGRKDPYICMRLADYVASKGLNRITLKEYYKLIFTQLSLIDVLKPKNKYLLFPWVYYLLKNKTLVLKKQA